MELHNRYGEEAYASNTAELKAQLKHLRQELKETDEAFPHLQTGMQDIDSPNPN